MNWWLAFFSLSWLVVGINSPSLHNKCKYIVKTSTHIHYKLVRIPIRTESYSLSCGGGWHHVPAPLREGEEIFAVTALSVPVCSRDKLRQSSKNCWFTQTLPLSQSLPTCVINGNDKDCNFSIRTNQRLITAAADLSCRLVLIRDTQNENSHSISGEEVKQNT